MLLKMKKVKIKKKLKIGRSVKKDILLIPTGFKVLRGMLNKISGDHVKTIFISIFYFFLCLFLQYIYQIL